MVALFSASVALVAPGAALGENGQIKLALLPVGQAGTFFDLSMRPGESRSLAVEIANDGTAALAARTYAADVYTIINGGFGARLRDQAQTGMTSWLDYPSQVLNLQIGDRIQRTFVVTVPAQAGPGEYIASLILENDQPIEGNGAVVLNQVVRQAVAVVVTVPGQRSPALAIGAASQELVAGKSIVSVAVENTGNVRLKPAVRFTLRDAAGVQVSQASIQMDTFYAHTNTFVEMPFATLLPPGAYTVRLTLDDATQGVRADEEAIPFVVEAPASTVPTTGGLPGLTGVSKASEGQISLPVWAVVLGLGLGLALGGVVIGAVFLVLRRRRWTRISER